MFSRRKARAAAAALVLLAAACAKKDDGVLATVGGASITKAEFDRKLGDVSSEYQTYVMTPAGRRQFFGILLREKLILAAAQDSAVPRSDEFRAEMDRFQAEQQRRLKEYREYLLAKQWIESLRQDGTLAVSDDEVRAYYEKHPKEVSLRHILVSTPEEAKALVKELRAGANFKTLAKEKSVDAETASSGGEIPPFLYGELLPELGDVAFPMRVGETAGPVRSEFGYHIVRKEGERTVPYAEAKDRLRKLLEKKKLDEHLDALRALYQVSIRDAQFQLIAARTATQGEKTLMNKTVLLLACLAVAWGRPAAAAPVDDVVATVNTNSILTSDYKKELSGVLDQYDHTAPEVVKDPEKLAKLKQQVLDDMIDKELLRQQADTMKVKVYSRELDNGVKEVKERFRRSEDGANLTDDQLDTAFAGELKKQGLTYAQFEEHVKRDLMIRKYVNENLRPEVKTPDEKEVRSFFDKVKFAVDGDTAAIKGVSDEELGEIMTLARQLKELTAARVRARHILIRVSRDATASQRADALAKIQAIKKQLDGGADFEPLAKKDSQDEGSAPRGGDLGYIVKGMTVPEFEKAAFALDVGQTSDIVETPFGYHIIRVDEKRAGRKLVYDDVKDDLTQFMTGQKLQRLVEAKVKELRAIATIQTFLNKEESSTKAEAPASSAGTPAKTQ